MTRHPSVTAGSALSLCELAPGRVVIGIATGDSAVWGVGLKPAKVSELCEYIIALKTLLRGEEAVFQGNAFRGHWKDFDPALAPPIYVACSGPRTLKASAQVADGLIIAEMGYTPEDIAYVRTLIEEGCAEVDRDPSELDLWWTTQVSFSDDLVHGMATAIGSSLWITWGSTKGKRIPRATSRSSASCTPTATISRPGSMVAPSSSWSAPASWDSSTGWWNGQRDSTAHPPT